MPTFQLSLPEVGGRRIHLLVLTLRSSFAKRTRPDQHREFEKRVHITTNVQIMPDIGLVETITVWIAVLVINYVGHFVLVPEIPDLETRRQILKFQRKQWFGIIVGDGELGLIKEGVIEPSDPKWLVDNEYLAQQARSGRAKHCVASKIRGRVPAGVSQSFTVDLDRRNRNVDMDGIQRSHSFAVIPSRRDQPLSPKPSTRKPRGEAKNGRSRPPYEPIPTAIVIVAREEKRKRKRPFLALNTSIVHFRPFKKPISRTGSSLPVSGTATQPTRLEGSRTEDQDRDETRQSLLQDEEKETTPRSPDLESPRTLMLGNNPDFWSSQPDLLLHGFAHRNGLANGIDSETYIGEENQSNDGIQPFLKSKREVWRAKLKTKVKGNVVWAALKRAVNVK